jgi:hypothetical protein
MSRYRTGIMPSKKFYTETGGVGARNVAVRNKINTQATPRPAQAAPTTDSSVNLFNIYTFTTTFSGNEFNGYPDKKLDSNYLNALSLATIRWKNFLSFHPDLINVIKTMYKSKFNREWRGLELLGINYSYTGGAAGASVHFFREYSLFDGWVTTKIPYGFLLSINKPLLTNGMVDSSGAVVNFSQKNIEDIFAHELGHALGLVNTFNSDYIVTLPSGPNLYPDGTQGSYYIPQHKCIIGGSFTNSQFPATYFEHYKLINSAKERFIGSSPYIMLHTDGKHWREFMVQHEMYSWDPPSSSYKKAATFNYGNFFNEIMAPNYNPVYANTNNYLITTKSLKYLTEIRVDGYRAYIEKTPGASEVKNVIKVVNPGSTLTKPDFTYILNGNRGVVVAPGSKSNNGIPVITVVEKVSEDATRDTDVTELVVNEDDIIFLDVETITETGILSNITYPEGYTHEYDNDEILRIVANHNKIVNDPSFAANTIHCCS